jgi:hypothetical protein
MADFDKMKYYNDQLAMLLADPQYGLFSWHQAVDNVMMELDKAWLKQKA